MGDHVDWVLSQWARQAPELDVSVMAVSSRVFRLATIGMRNVERSHRAHGLQPGEFDVLATLYRCGPPYGLSPQRLVEALLLSSGAMTNRLDRLEAAGWLARKPNPDDRRSIIVSLTDDGMAVIKQALQSYVAELQRMLEPLSAAQRIQLADSLRTLLLPHDLKAPGGTDL